MTNIDDILVQETSLETAASVHSKIPEFDSDYIERFYEEKAAKNNPYIMVAYVNKQPAGYMIAFNRLGSLYMWLAGVVPEYRRYHLFTLMTGKLENEANRRHQTRLTVKTYERFPAMIKALDELGFKADERSDTAIFLGKTLK